MTGGPTRLDHDWARRATQLLVGLLLFSFSMALMVRAGLGAMPWDVLHQGLALRSGVSFGLAVLAVTVLVLMGWILIRQRPGIGTVANLAVIAASVDWFLTLIPAAPDTAAAVGYLAAGIALNAIATAAYIGARLGPGPRDGLMTGIVARSGRPVWLVRTTIEVAVVATGWLLGGTFGVGTLAYAALIGPLVQPLLPRFRLPSGPAEAIAAENPTAVSTIRA